jgi:hypothetical protein
MTAGTAPTALTRSTSAFNSTPLTVSIVIDTSAQSTLGDIGSVVIESSPAHTVLARADLDSSAQTLTFSIMGTASAPVAIVSGTLYRVTFVVDGSNMAMGMLNSGTPTTPVAVATQMVDLALQAN